MSTFPDHDALLAEATKLSGASKEPGGGVYSSYTHPKFTVNNGRNTKDRLNMFEVESNLEGKTVLDLGCNTGAVAVEMARRGAKVVGVEINQDRVDFCNKLAATLKLDAVFYQGDVRHGMPPQLAGRKYDIVLSLSIDGYMNEPDKLYRLLGDVTEGMCYLESNFPSSESTDIRAEVKRIKRLMPPTFKTVKYIGCSTPNGRRMFVASNVYHQMSRTSSYIVDDWYVRRFACYDEWDKLRLLTEKLVGITQVPAFDFSTEYEMKTKKVPGVKWPAADKSDLPSWRKQLVSVVRQLNARGLAHRDLHLFNLIFDRSKMWVIDWEYLCENPVPLDVCYDLTGLNCDVPGRGQNNIPQHVFSSINNMRAIGGEFGIEMADFMKHEKIMLV